MQTKTEMKMKNSATKALPNRTIGTRLAIGLTGLVFIALIMQLWR
jgi:hypothetical protein